MTDAQAPTPYAFDIPLAAGAQVRGAAMLTSLRSRYRVRGEAVFDQLPPAAQREIVLELSRLQAELEIDPDSHRVVHLRGGTNAAVMPAPTIDADLPDASHEPIEDAAAGGGGTLPAAELPGVPALEPGEGASLEPTPRPPPAPEPEGGGVPALSREPQAVDMADVGPLEDAAAAGGVPPVDPEAVTDAPPPAAAAAGGVGAQS